MRKAMVDNTNVTYGETTSNSMSTSWYVGETSDDTANLHCHSNRCIPNGRRTVIPMERSRRSITSSIPRKLVPLNALWVCFLALISTTTATSPMPSMALLERAPSVCPTTVAHSHRIFGHTVPIQVLTLRGGGTNDNDKEEPMMSGEHDETNSSNGAYTSPANNEEDALLDDIVDQLVAGVATDSNTSSSLSESESESEPEVNLQLHLQSQSDAKDATVDDAAGVDDDAAAVVAGVHTDFNEIHASLPSITQPQHTKQHEQNTISSSSTTPTLTSHPNTKRKRKRKRKQKRKHMTKTSNQNNDIQLSSNTTTQPPSQPPSQPTSTPNHQIAHKTPPTLPSSPTKHKQPSLTPSTTPLSPTLPQRPNAIYRFLLENGGILGRTIVSISVLLTEFVRRYLPELYHLTHYGLTKLLYHTFFHDNHPNSPTRNGTRTRPIRRLNDEEDVTIGAGRASKRTVGKREDTIALEKIQSVASGKMTTASGSTNDAVVDREDLAGGKYAHLSVAFMRKYSLGRKFRKERIEYERVIGSLVVEDDDDIDNEDVNDGLGGAPNPSGTSDDDLILGVGGIVMDDEHVRIPSTATEKETDWVVTAFTTDGNSALPFAKILGQTRLTDRFRTTNTYDDDDYYPDNADERNYRKRTEALLKAAASSNIEQYYPKVVAPSTSKRSLRKSTPSSHSSLSEEQSDNEDRDSEVNDGREASGGGRGGVWERIRSVSATDYIPSRILGAYPGDAPPIEEAANANGVIELARRYGYGDWSDDGDVGEEDGDNGDNAFGDDFGGRKKKRRRRSRGMGGNKRDPSETHDEGSNEKRESRRKKQHRSEGWQPSFELSTGSSSSSKRGRRLHDKGFSFTIGSSTSFGTTPKGISKRPRVRNNMRENRFIRDLPRNEDDARKSVDSTKRRRRRRTMGTDNVRLPMERTMELENSLLNFDERKNIHSSDFDVSSKKQRTQSQFRQSSDPTMSVQTPMKRTQAIFHPDEKDH